MVLLGGNADAYGGAWGGNDDDWGIHADDGVPRLEVRIKPDEGITDGGMPDGLSTFGRAPCKFCMEGNCSTRNTKSEKL